MLHTDAQKLHQILFYHLKQLYRKLFHKKMEDLDNSHIYAPKHLTKTWPKNLEENSIAVYSLTFKSIPICLTTKTIKACCN